MAGLSDVVVVGAGVIGLGIAWRAARAGMTVAVCDPEPARGASWAAAGMLAPVTEASVAETPLAAFALASLARWPDFAAEVRDDSGIDPGLRVEGTLAVAWDDDDRRALEELSEIHRLLGLASEWVTPSACRRLEPELSPRVRGGLRVDGDWQVDNRALVAALLEAAQRRGVRVYRSAVRRVVADEHRSAGVELEDGQRLAADHVVVAAGPWSAQLPGLPPAARPPVRPVKGDILRLAGPTGEALLTRTVRAVVQGRSVYIVPRRSGEIVVGASMEEAGFGTEVRAGAVYELLASAIAVVPALAELPLTEMIARLRPTTPDNAPVLGPTPLPGLTLATGHHRNGILLTPATTDALVAVLAGEPLPAAAAPFALDRFA